MALTEDTVPYEVLFRFAPDGTLRGCHYQGLHRILRDGVVIQEQPTDAQPVIAGVTTAGLDLSPLLGTLATSQQATIEQQQATIATLQAQVADLTAKLAAATPA